MEDAAALMEEVRKLGLESDLFDEKYITHRRGDFVAIPVGVSYGGGGTVCSFSPSSSMLTNFLLTFRSQATLFIRRPGGGSSRGCLTLPAFNALSASSRVSSTRAVFFLFDGFPRRFCSLRAKALPLYIGNSRKAFQPPDWPGSQLQQQYLSRCELQLRTQNGFLETRRLWQRLT